MAERQSHKGIHFILFKQTFIHFVSFDMVGGTLFCKHSYKFFFIL